MSVFKLVVGSNEKFGKFLTLFEEDDVESFELPDFIFSLLQVLPDEKPEEKKELIFTLLQIAMHSEVRKEDFSAEPDTEILLNTVFSLGGDYKETSNGMESLEETEHQITVYTAGGEDVLITYNKKPGKVYPGNFRVLFQSNAKVGSPEEAALAFGQAFLEDKDAMYCRDIKATDDLSQDAKLLELGLGEKDDN